MRKLCVLTAVVIMSLFCLSCDTEGGAERKAGILDDIQYSKADYLLELGRFAGLDEDTEWQIVQAYLKKHDNDNLTINDVWVEQYYGSYCPAYNIQDLYADGYTWEEIIALENKVFAILIGNKNQDNGTEQQEVSIEYGKGKAFVRDGNRIFLWHDGQLYDLADYYSGGLLLPWDFLGIANQQNGLEPETQLRIQEDYGKSLPYPWNPELYDEMPIQYLGTYNGYTALTFHGGSGASAHTQIIDGVHFFHPYWQNRVFAWKEGEIYELAYLYKNNFITREDLVEMAYFHYGTRVEE